MSDASVAAELSMDEILMKIQRTIAMDGGMESRPAASLPPSIEAPHAGARDDETQGEPHKAAEAVIPERGERLLSPAVAGAAAAAFTQIATIRRQQRRVSEFPMGGEQRTLEDLVRELLRPMMRGWLEEKLMSIVERAVKTELARALGEAERA
jgi:cell pole-organizing protein PopZ